MVRKLHSTLTWFDKAALAFRQRRSLASFSCGASVLLLIDGTAFGQGGSQILPQSELMKLSDAYSRPVFEVSSIAETNVSIQACEVTDILTDTEGERIALFSEQARAVTDTKNPRFPFPRSVYIVDNEQNTLTKISSTTRIEPIVWTSDTRTLIVNVGRRVIASIRPGRNKFEDGIDLGPDASDFDFIYGFAVPKRDAYSQIYSSITDSDLNEFLKDRSSVSAIMLSNGGVDVIVIDKLTGEAYSSSRYLNDALFRKIFSVRDFVTYSHRKGQRPVYFGIVDRHLLNVGPFSRPIVDRVNGALVGSFNQKNLRWLGNDRSVNLNLRPDEVILDAEIAGDRLIYLSEDISGQKFLTARFGGGTIRRQICPSFVARYPSAPSQPTSFLSVSVGFMGHTSGTPAKDRVSFVLLKRRDSARRAVVIFKGGPLETVSEPSIPNEARTEDVRCGDIFLIDGSGAIGTDFEHGSRIARHGFSSFIYDIKSIKRFLDREGYDRVDVVSESFGGFHAAASLRVSWPELNSVSAIAPPLRILSIEEIIAAASIEDFDNVSIRSSKKERDFVFGNRIYELNLQIVASFLRFPLKSHLYVADKDAKVPLRVIPESVLQRNATIIDGDHQSIFRNRNVWRAINERICGP